MPLIEAGGRKVYYELHPARESSESVPLVLLNGIGGSCRGWLPLQVPELSRRRPVLIFDHRGVGESEDPGGPFSTSDLARDTAELIETLELGPVDALGGFMGGMVVQELALAHPETIRRLVLVGTYARPDAKRRMLLEDWAGLARQGVSLESLIRKRLVWTLADETLEQTDLIETMLDFFLREAVPLTSDLFMRQCEACLRHDTSSRLGQIRQPTLVLCGKNDMLTPPKFSRALADGIPGSRLVVMEFGAHLVMAESAQAFNHAVLQFLDERR